MAAFRKGVVIEVTERRADLLRTVVRIGGSEILCSAFPSMLGAIEVDDEVVVNTTGVELGLGTGGEGFILWNLSRGEELAPGEGHIVKLRYTPWQTEVLAAEAPESPHHEVLAKADSLLGAPVIVCGLHSQVGAAAAGIKAAAPQASVGYLMTDAAALPLAWSDSVRALKDAGLLDVTCTSGHAFGGDLESVNAFSGMLALRHAAEVDAVVVAMGPGVVGTDTKFGFSALEQGQLLDAAGALQGAQIAALRISFVDLRKRHVGISHHTLTALMSATQLRCRVALPILPDEREEEVQAQLDDWAVADRHEVVTIDGAPGLRLMSERKLRPSSMGRALDETPELFVAASAAGALGARFLGRELGPTTED